MNEFQKGETLMIKERYDYKELKQILAVCSTTFYNLNGFLPDLEELCRQVGAEYRTAIRYWMAGGLQPCRAAS